LFAGSDRGESAAVLYNLIGTAKLNGIDPEAYLRNVLSQRHVPFDGPTSLTAFTRLGCRRGILPASFLFPGAPLGPE